MKTPIDVRWILVTIVLVMSIGVGGILFAPNRDAATLAVVAGFVSTTLAALGAMLRGEQNHEQNREALANINHAVNGKLQARLDQQDADLHALKQAVGATPSEPHAD